MAGHRKREGPHRNSLYYRPNDAHATEVSHDLSAPLFLKEEEARRPRRAPTTLRQLRPGSCIISGKSLSKYLRTSAMFSLN
jgi:hypothetical protein